jgi:hypothetical protein
MRCHRSSLKSSTHFKTSPPGIMELSLPTYDPENARQRGYTSITTPISKVAESEILCSIDQSLSTCDACWIKSGPNHLEAGRRSSELCKTTE